MSCADVQTIQAGNGSTTQFSFDFPYIFKSEIHVYFWNATTKEWDEKLTNDATYPWQVTDANPTIVEFTSTAPPSPAAPVDPGETAVDNIRIRRITNIDDIRALFNPGSAIRSDDLNKNFEQLRYAIQEAGCQGVTDDVYQYLLDNYWDRFDNTIYSADAWRSDDATIATTAALDQRFQDEVNDTLTKAELAAAGLAMPNNDNAVPTTGAVNDYINEVITNDIGTDGTGITVTDDGDGTITLGLAANSIDFDRIKDVDIITQAEQNAGSPAASDTNLFTALAAARRFDTIVQTSTPSGSNWEVGKTWLQNDANLTLSVWNGSAWLGLASGGTFTNQPKVVYVDASAGSDNNDGHRISRPKATIKAAIQQINNDATYGDGSIVVVAPGVYQEVAPIDIQKSNVSIIGTALRSCIVHPTPATETNVLFRVNSGSYLQNLTFTGMKASGALGNTVDAALPVNQGWNVSFYPGATIIKSPYIQNCTNFSDSEIDNSNLNVITPAGGAAGDTDSAPTGGGLLVDGSVVAAASPLRSMVCDSYTHVGLNGPGILVTNNGYAQCTSSYAFFNKYHIKCLNGGQANLAASTTDFGDQALVADGKSTAAIFTAALSTSASNGATTFTINAPTAGASWHGSATRPQGNMLVVLNGITYPILSATANGSGWDVTISRPNPTNRSENLGLNGAVNTPATASFYLRSMIASSGHTMEYVGSGTNYSALPENGGVPDNTKQVVELNNGKVWTAITDQNGKFKVGDFFEVDQQLGFVTIPNGSIAFDLASDPTPQLGGNLDVLNRTISSSTGNVRIDDTLVVNSGTAATPAVTFNGDTNTGLYSPGVDELALSTAGSARLTIDPAGAVSIPGTLGVTGAITGNLTGSASNNVLKAGDTMTGALGVTAGTAGAPSVFISGDTNTGIYSPGADQVGISTNGSGRLFIDSNGRVGIGATTAFGPLSVNNSAAPSTSGNINSGLVIHNGTTGTALNLGTNDSGGYSWIKSSYVNNADAAFPLAFFIGASERMRLDSSGRLGLGTSSASFPLHLVTSGNSGAAVYAGTSSANQIYLGNTAGESVVGTLSNHNFGIVTNGGQKVTVTTGGSVGIGTTSPTNKFVVASSGVGYEIDQSSIGNTNLLLSYDRGASAYRAVANYYGGTYSWNDSGNERARIDSSGRLLVGTTTARSTSGFGSPRLQLVGNYESSILLTENSDNNNSNGLVLSKIRGTSIVQNGDPLGYIQFTGYDGSIDRAGAYINANVDGTPGAGDMPTRLVFSTTADGTSSPTERMRIQSDGVARFTTDGTYTGVDTNSHAVRTTIVGTWLIDTYHGAGSGANGIHVEYATTPNGSGNHFFYADDATAKRFTVRSNGGIENYQANDANLCDEREKKNIETLESTWNCLKDWEIKKFHYNEDAETDSKRYGVIAQQVAEHCPEVITDWVKQKAKDAELDEDGNIVTPAKEEIVRMGVKEQQMYWMAIKALQEAQVRIEALEAEVAALKAQ